MPAIVETTDLTKTYRGHAAVDGVDLTIPEGCVYGFLGPNGSGKSTTMKMLLGLVTPSRGEVRAIGSPMQRSTRRDLLRSIGSLIETPPGYAHLTGRENMRIIQRLLDLDGRHIEDAVRAVRMQDQMHKKVREYSLGMKQRLGIAMALARTPRLLILDEPTNGLDPAGIEEIRVLLGELAADGVSVMVSSHLLGEIDRTASHLGILAGGQLIFQGTRAELMAASTPDVLIRCADPRAAHTVLASHLEVTLENRVPGGATTGDAVLRLPGLDQATTARAVSTLCDRRIGVHEVRRDEQTLEDVFRDLTAGGAL